MEFSSSRLTRGKGYPNSRFMNNRPNQSEKSVNRLCVLCPFDSEELDSREVYLLDGDVTLA